MSTKLEAEIKYLRASLEADESHAAHLEDLRQKVLEPMLDYLNEYMLPVLDRRIGNVVLLRVRVPRTSGGFMDEPTEFIETFGVGTAAEAPLDPVMYPEGDTPLKPIRDGALYSDARDNHYQVVIQSWEKLLTEFDKYNTESMDYTAHLRSEVSKVRLSPNTNQGELKRDGYGPRRWQSSYSIDTLVCSGSR